jgi:hypothetical protein
MSMSLLDATAVNVAVSRVQANLVVTATEIQWVATVCPLDTGVGWLSGAALESVGVFDVVRCVDGGFS